MNTQKISEVASEIFSKKITADYWHFSTEFVLPRSVEFEVFCEKGDFIVTIGVNEKGQPLKSTFKAVKK